MTTRNLPRVDQRSNDSLVNRPVAPPAVERVRDETNGAEDLARELSRLATAAEQERDRQREAKLAQERERAKYD